MPAVERFQIMKWRDIVNYILYIIAYKIVKYNYVKITIEKYINKNIWKYILADSAFYVFF